MTTPNETVVGVLTEALAVRLQEIELAGAYVTVNALASELASVVAALPNIAIVPLPEPTVREYGGFAWGADDDGENPTVTVTAGYDTVRLYQEDARHTSEDAVEIAGFLLAASRVATNRGGQS